MYNEDELIPPSFLNKKLFENALKHHLNEPTVTVIDLNFQPACKAGDHFGSLMFKVEIIYKKSSDSDRKVLRVVVKTVPTEEGYKKNLLNYERVFNLEIEFYTKIIPALETALQSAGDEMKISPGYIFHCSEPYHVLIMADITEHGFVLSDELFDLENTKKITAKLAKFHAASMVVNETTYPLTHIQSSYFHIGENEFDLPTQVLLPSVKLYREAVKSRAGFERLAEKLKDFEENFVSKLERIYKRTDDKSIVTLCHADFHIKNVMLQSCGVETLSDILFFDYQLSVWGTPAIDIAYIFYQLGDLETRLVHRKEIERHYYDQLTSTLRKLKYAGKIFSYEEFQAELRANVATEIMQIICFYKYRFMNWNVENVSEAATQDPMYMTKSVFAKPEFLELTKKDLERCFDYLE